MLPRATAAIAIISCASIALPAGQRAEARAPERELDAEKASAPSSPLPTEVPSPLQLQKQARGLVQVVARLRGLRPRHAVAMGVLSRGEIMAEVRKRLAQDYTEEEIRAESAILARLGLLPPNVDYKQAILELLTDQVAGFYDPEKKRLNIADWLPLMLQKPTLAHEICHALQDQHFDLKRFVRPAKDNSDRQLARAALVEGDCTGVMLEYVLAPSGVDLSSMSGAMEKLISGVLGSGSAKFQQAPYFLRETLTFPYLHGLRFIQRLRATKSWATVSRLFRRPPPTSEQILHFDKFEAGERARPIRVRPIAALSGHRLLKRDTIGEFQLKLFLRQALDEPTAARAAAGWGGDRLAAYRRRQDASLPLLIHLSIWDSEADAIEFLAAEQKVFDKLTVKRLDSKATNTVVYRDSEALEWIIERRSTKVLTIMAAPHAIRTRLQQQVWRRWQF